jgi:glycogen(starch) synthase
MARDRVLYWVQQFLPYIGGVQILGAKLLPALRERGYEFTVVASKGHLDLPEVTDFQGIPVYRFPFWEALTKGDPGLVLETRKRIADLKREFRPQLVHVNLTDPSVFFHLQTPVDPSPTFLLTTQMAMTQETADSNTVLGRALRSADRVTTISRAMLENLVGLVPEVGDKSQVVYNGLEPPALAPASLPMEPPHLLCLGRLSEEKGFDVALEALPTIIEEVPSVEMTVAGDGPALASLEVLAETLGLDGRVRFPGWIEPDQVPELINTSTLVLMPSRWWEGFGLVALQAHQMARPVVASRVGGLPEVVADGDTGLLVEKDEPRDLARAVVSLLADPDRARAMGKAARIRSRTVFGWETHVNRYDDIYREMISPS